jgi:hypothetical protein
MGWAPYHSAIMDYHHCYVDIALTLVIPPPFSSLQALSLLLNTLFHLTQLWLVANFFMLAKVVAGSRGLPNESDRGTDSTQSTAEKKLIFFQ